MTVGARWRARRWRYLGYATGALLLSVVVLTVGSWLVVRTWGPELARERLEPVLTAALGRPTRAERGCAPPGSRCPPPPSGGRHASSGSACSPGSDASSWRA